MELAAGMEHVSVINPGEGLEARPVDDTLFACPLCPKQKATTWRRIQGHFEGHVNTAFRFEDKIICRCSMPCRDAAHYHCPLCWTTIIRKEQMRFHIKFCRRKTTPLTFVPAYNMPPHKRDHDYSWLPPTPNDSDRSPQRPSAPSSPEVAPPDDHDPPQPTSTSCDSTTGPEELVRPKAFPTQTLKRAKCPHCGLLLYKKNLAAHVQRKHTQKKEKPALKSVCIDRANGIFAVRKAFSHGFSTPVHVQRKTGEQQQTTCELRECRELLMLAQRSGLTPTECEHIRSLQFSCDSAAEEPLQADVLDEMVSLNLFGAAAANDCKDRQKAAQEAGVPLSVPVNFGGSPRQICVSVHEPKTLYYSVLGRVIVTYKTLRNTWHCPCAKPHKSCPHKNIARWHLFQTRKHLFTPPSQTEENSEAPPSPDRSSSEDLEKSVRYVYEKKKIPADLQGDANAVKAPTENPEKLLPVETVCPLCSDEPPLTDAFLVTDAAMVVGMAGLGRNVSTYNKRCSCCGGVYRYQEWRDGLHNFNDRVLLTLELCFYLRINLQSHVSVSACVTCLEKLHGKKFPPADTILRAYLHFEALSSTEYAYACVNCGPSPPVVVLERHRKAVCNLEVSELRTPSEDYDGQQNISDFWDAINLDMISRGFFPKSSTNPFVVKPSYENWAPWIGKQTRKSDSVFNTEYKKITQDQTEADLSEAAEDRLFDILLQQQTWTIRKLCRTCNVDTTGSRLDLIKRLQEKMEIRQTHDKVLQSLWGASGGWSVVLCPHGVVYALKLNLRNESPRDFADLLLSWKHFPNICLYDFAHDLVTHTNLRTVDDPVFQPDEGKLAEPTPENLQEAARGKLRVSLPWLAEKSNLPDENAHPVTGSNQRYVLYDKFHEADPDDPEEVLRSVNLVPEIPGSVNGPAAEQLFSDMRKNDDFLNIMAPSTHVFLMRNIIQHRNTESNRKLVARQLKRGRHGVFQLKRLKVK
ncbi:uncharacterized protein LOC112148182 isoform X2 [Oryzias melastigma]|uniref:uncharacterized protein LOC112148182 isoform X2 n=1 Tax=Oryzias melastigma TaxID=30732 RepID=UPI000CF7F87F|nr:uncharacterized protein LOC112148182 isoform X2 [Oryzias melastigma]